MHVGIQGDMLEHSISWNALVLVQYVEKCSSFTRKKSLWLKPIGTTYMRVSIGHEFPYA